MSGRSCGVRHENKGPADSVRGTCRRYPPVRLRRQRVRRRAGGRRRSYSGSAVPTLRGIP